MYNIAEAAKKNAVIMCCGEKSVLVANVEGIADGMVPFLSPIGYGIVNFPVDGELTEPEPVDDIRKELPGTVWMRDDSTCTTDMDIVWDYNSDIPALFGIRTGEADPVSYCGDYSGAVFYLNGDEYKFIVPNCWL